jgi:putative oxidoreductase
MAGKVILLALRTALAWTFIHAGALKIWDFKRGQPATQDFVVAIQQFHLLPSPDVSVLLAVYLPWVEIFAALGLFARRVQLGAASTIMAMTALFMGALASAWARGLRIECGCFGRDEAATDIPGLILRDGCILVAALVLFFVDSRKSPSQERSMFAESGRFTLP